MDIASPLGLFLGNEISTTGSARTRVVGKKRTQKGASLQCYPHVYKQQLLHRVSIDNPLPSPTHSDFPTLTRPLLIYRGSDI